MLRRLMIAVAGQDGGAWATRFFNQVVNYAWSPGWAGYNMRLAVPPRAVVAGSRVRLGLLAHTKPLVIKKALIGVRQEAGNGYGFASTPAAVTVAGAVGFTLQPGVPVLTDDIELAVPAGASLLFSVDVTSGDMGADGGQNAAGFLKWEKLAGDAGDVSPSGYAGPVSAIYLIQRIDIYSP